jgi:hypothetical protein
MNDNNALFNRLVSHLHADVHKRNGVTWAETTCPACGKEPKKGQVHFSFSDDGRAKCLVCGQGYNLLQLSRVVGIDDDRPYIPPAPSQKIKSHPNTPTWIEHAEEILDTYTTHPDLYDLWAQYKPLSDDLIRAYRLGVGVLPQYSSRCQHERLIVPLISGGEIRGFRGRSLGCDCGKWLSASTNPDWTKFLFNGACLVQDQATARERNLGYSNSGYARGEALLIVENPADAILAEQKLGVWAVATLGVTIWRDDWTQSLIECKPSSIVVGYDKDLAGNSRTPQMEREWLAKNPKAKVIPIPNGVRLVNHLLKAGLPASLFRWPKTAPPKCDIGYVLSYL